MSGPLDADAYESPGAPRHQLVLVDGRTFAISDESGRMWAPTHGLVHDDLRHVSRLAVSIDGSPAELLASTAATPLSAVIVSRFDAGPGSRPAGCCPSAVGWPADCARTSTSRTPPAPSGSGGSASR